MKVRQIVLDTETTGLKPKDGDRIIQIAGIEMINGEATGKHYNTYINPERDSHPEALKVHGLTTEFLSDKPKFSQVVDEFLKFIEGAELIIHNAPFDVGFLNHELSLISKPALTNAIVDTRVIAQQLYTKKFLTTELIIKELVDDENVVNEQRKKSDSNESLIAGLVENPNFRVNTLDHLCKYFRINLSSREKHHGALVDCELLAQVYFHLKQEQVYQEISKITLSVPTETSNSSITNVSLFQLGRKQTLEPQASELQDIKSLSYYLAQEPNDEKVQCILSNNPKLLNIVFKEIVGQSQTFINVTPLQLVYGAGDDVMCNTLKPFFVQLHGSERAGIEEMQRQISEMTKADEKGFDFGPIIQAISKESSKNGGGYAQQKWIVSPATLAAIKTFREDFDASQPKIIDKGMHFRWETLQELFQQYVTAMDKLDYAYHKNALLLDAVLAWVLGYVPVNGAQYFNQGLNYLQKENPEPFTRANTIRNGKNFYATLKEQSLDFPFEGSCVDIIHGVKQEKWGRRGGEPMFDFGPLLETFVEQKLQALQNLCSHTRELKFNV